MANPDPAVAAATRAIPHMQALLKGDPAFGELAVGVRAAAMADGAIPAKYKLLMAMVCDAMRDRPAAIVPMATQARAAGASEQEIFEAVQVAYHLGGTYALSNVHTALTKGLG